jgi:hypothetical protein
MVLQKPHPLNTCLKKDERFADAFAHYQNEDVLMPEAFPQE